MSIHLVLSLILLLPADAHAGRSDAPVTPAARLAAQRAVERLYESHRAGPGRPIDAASADAAASRRVERALAQSVALAEFWDTPITAEALARELRRIEAGSLLPDRLREIEVALGGDRRLMAETVARATLADRLVCAFLASDERVQGERRRQAEAILAALRDGTLDPEEADPRRVVVTSESTPQTAVQESLGSFTIEFPLATPDTHALYVVPKVTWDEWWASVSDRFDPSRLESLDWTEQDLAGTAAALAPNPPTCAVEDLWAAGRIESLPAARMEHTSVWTGSEMIVWGGRQLTGGSLLTNSGGRYDPALDTWSATSTVNAPTARHQHSAVWTGSVMVVWGGDEGGSYPRTGGRYDPATDTWAPTSTSNAPTGRIYQSAVWSGTEMLIWGDIYTTAGARYNPVTDIWTPMSQVNAPTARYEQAAVWTGTEMIIWGGAHTQTGARYNPSNDTWTPVSTVNAPSPRTLPGAVWTGTEMIVWGAFFSGYNPGGGRYNPATDTWTALPSAGEPPNRYNHSMIWTGTKMIVWGGNDFSHPQPNPQLNDGATYDPATNTWASLVQTNPPSPRAGHTTVWTGDQMIIWGATTNSSGGRYRPASNSWTPTRMTRASPLPRSDPASFWTGSEMILWGGYGTNTGGRYDPITDTWQPTSVANAPSNRHGATTVWTGTEMVVWGGQSDASSPVGTGGRYNPGLDLWSPISLAGAPAPRYEHSAVWTGTEMIVWGGRGSSSFLGDGSRYNPANNTWSLLPAAGAPSARESHSAVWSGTEMIVWGGHLGSQILTNDGGRFNPQTGLWTPTSLVDVPAPRALHAAVWTGTEMIVWSPDAGRTGGRYNPSSDTWQPTSTTNAPSAWGEHAPIWTGTEMIVWGGAIYCGWGCPITNLNTGARYNPALDQWTPTTTAGAPPGRIEPVAVWTGSAMIIWGGGYFGGDVLFSRDDQRVFLYGDTNAAPPANLDGDAWNTCADCDDTNAAAWGQPGEVTDLFFLDDQVTLSWTPPARPGGLPVRYDTLRADSLSGFGSMASCVESDDPSDTTAIDSALPALGQLFLYLVRAENACPGGMGSGSLGSGTSGPLLTGRACP